MDTGTKKVWYVRDLLRRLNDRSDDAMGGSSLPTEEQVSFKAHREVENLNDPELIDIIIQESKPFKGQYEKATTYWAISKLWGSEPHAGALEFLLSESRTEKRNYVLERLLDCLWDHPSFAKRMNELLPLAHSKLTTTHFGLLGQVCRVVGEVGSSDSVPLIQAALKAAKHNYQIGTLLHALARTSSMDDAELILGYWYSKDDWLVGCVTHCFAEWGKADATPLLIRALEHKRHHCKYEALYAIDQYADARAVEPVLERLKYLLKSKMVQRYRPDSEIALACRYLSRVSSDSPEAIEGLDLVRRKWDSLDDYDKEWFRAQVPVFVNLA